MKNGWRKVFHENLCKITNANHQEIDSTLGATNIVSNSMLVEEKVCRYNPDIVFFDFVINDKDGLSCPKNLIKTSLEEAVKHILYNNPNCIIVFLYMHSKHDNGYDWVMKIYDEVADKYQINSINVAQYIHNIPNGHDLYFKDSCHPNDSGINLISNIISEGFQQIIQEPEKPSLNTYIVDFPKANLPKTFYKIGEVLYQNVQEPLELSHQFVSLCIEMIVGPETHDMITELDGVETTWSLQDPWTTYDRITHKIIYTNLENIHHKVIIKPTQDSKLYLTRYFYQS